MPSLSIQVPHQLGQAEAQVKLQNLFNENQDAVNQKVSDLEQSWRGHILDYAFKSMGMKISGTLDVQPDSVQIVAQLPLAAIMFKGMIETQLRDGLTKVLQSPA